MSACTREARLRRHRRVRGKIRGTAERPRLAVYRSNRGIFAQLVDDDTGKTLVSASLDRAQGFKGDKTGQAHEVGKTLAAAAKKAGIETRRLRPRRLPVPRTREGSRRGCARGRTELLMAVDIAETRELKERVVEINRVAKVVKGGRRFSFTALVVIGDEVDRVGVGYGKAREVPLAISKAVDDAKKNLFTVPKHGQTITHEVLGRFGAARVLLRPASPGTGVIAGGGVRAVLELGGIRDVLAKSLGTTNPINMLKAAEAALRDLRRPEEVAAGARQGGPRRAPGPRPKVAAARRSRPAGRPLPRRVAEEVSEAGPSRESRRRQMPRLRLTQTGSAIGQSPRHRGTLRALGLGRIGKSREHDVTPALAGHASEGAPPREGGGDLDDARTS